VGKTCRFEENQSAESVAEGRMVKFQVVTA
jgi:hypothetical protein